MLNQSINILYYQINLLKSELYDSIESENNLINNKTYSISKKLDKLIVEYQMKTPYKRDFVLSYK